MTAGQGIVHSERIPAELVEKGFQMHGVQAWVALPKEFEDGDPSFQHCSKSALPVREEAGSKHILIAGEAFGLKSPAKTFSRLFYIHSVFEPGSKLRFSAQGQESAFFLIEGTLRVDGQNYTGPGLLHFKFDSIIEFDAQTRAEGLLLGGDPLPEHRTIWWNFVSSEPEKIALAKKKWREQSFPKIPDETDFIPLPT
jgi:redox-sensitive bicupin YhaK (pirin superfamily)